MSSLLIDRYVRMIEPHSLTFKLDLLKAITESIKLPESKKITERKKLFSELKGAWIDMDESLEQTIIDARTTSDKEVSFD